MKVGVFLLLSLITSPVFSETRGFICVFDNIFDTPVDTNVFFSLTKKEKKYIDDNGNKYLIFFEDNKHISLVSEKDNNVSVEVIVINKTNMKIIKSSTWDDLVSVIKGDCKK